MDITDTLNELAVLNQFCGLYHVDIMDGHFVQNITLSADFVGAIRNAAKLPIEVHLMVTEPDSYIARLINVGADYITVHAETIQTRAFRTMHDIHKLGCKAGVCLCPATPVSAVMAYLDEVDIVTVMTVDPGYAGQEFIPQMVHKVAELERIRSLNSLNYLIQCDGAIGLNTYKPLYEAGARSFVMGSSGLFFKENTLKENCKRMRMEFTAATGVQL
jgi:D-allulose-6-phosphate 3-epimerase